MKSKFIHSIFMAIVATVVIAGINSCKKYKDKPKEEKKVVLGKSKKELLTSSYWVLKELTENDTLRILDGNDKVEFTKDGKFLYSSRDDGNFNEVGTYTFLDKDSTILEVYFYSFYGQPMYWNIYQLDETNLKYTYNVTDNRFKYHLIKD